MKVIVAGHVYLLEDVDRDRPVELETLAGEVGQLLRFVRRRDAQGEPLAVQDCRRGVLTQELLRVAIDRTLYLYAEEPCEEDTAIVEHLRAALLLYESRAARRALERVSKPEELVPCVVCGHILCGVHR